MDLTLIQKTILIPGCVWRGDQPSPVMARVYHLFNIEDPWHSSWGAPANDNRPSS